MTGADVLAADQFDQFRGKRVGLITNQTARVDSIHLIDALYQAPDVSLTALFGPEHGIRGTAADGIPIADSVDNATGIPVYSLYGSSMSPSPDVLSGLDVLVFDIQDVGARFYTFISTLGRAMQAAARADVPFVVLDRPNPLGGYRVEGFVADESHRSNVGLYPIPVVHGMTVGELSLMIKGENFLDGVRDVDLTVIRMQGWHRSMLWPDTGIPWVPTSPNIPTFLTALVYPGTCFFEGTIVSEGRGTDAPFLTIGAPWLDTRSVVRELNGMGLPGVLFSRTETVPRSIPGVAVNPKFEDETLRAISIQITSPRAYSPLTIGMAMLSATYRMAPDSLRRSFFRERWLGLLAGTDRLLDSLYAGTTSPMIVLSWTQEVEDFKKLRAPYLRYD